MEIVGTAHEVATDAVDLTAKYIPAEVDGEPRIITIHGDFHAPQIEVWVCQWFVGCDREAVTMVDHPAITEGVPTCAKHAEWVGQRRAS